MNKLEAALDLLRRLPPQQTPQHLLQLSPLLSDQDYRLLQATIDLPPRIAQCKLTGRDFLVADYNTHDKAIRSPWSGQWQSNIGDSSEETLPAELSSELRQLEVVANQAFDTYRQLYFEGGVSSVYCWPLSAKSEGALPSDSAQSETAGTTQSEECDTPPSKSDDTPPSKSDDSTQHDTADKGSWAMAVLIQKHYDDDAQWDSFHVIEAKKKGDVHQYDLCSTVLLHLPTLNGHLTRQSQASVVNDTIHGHVCQIGRMVEEAESRLRSNLQEIYFGKTHDIINELRSAVPPGYLRKQVEKTYFTKNEAVEGEADLEKTEVKTEVKGEVKKPSNLAAQSAVAQEMMAKLRERNLRMNSMPEAKNAEQQDDNNERSQSIY